MSRLGTPVYPTLRHAAPADLGAIGALMRTSVMEIFPRWYDAVQTASAALHVARPDAALIDDGTFFVYQAGDEIVACGGWSRRAKAAGGPPPDRPHGRVLDPGAEPAHVRATFVRDGWTRQGLGRAILTASRRAAAAQGFLALSTVATLPGVPLYTACGFLAAEPVDLVLADGTTLPCLAMDRPIG